MRTCCVLIAVLAAGCASPTAPSAPPPPREFFFPEELRSTLSLMDGDSWVHPLLGETPPAYLRRYVAGIELDPNLTATPERWAFYDAKTRIVRWSPLHTPAQFVSQRAIAAVLLHEARHGQGFTHTCGSSWMAGDRTIEEGGPYAVQIAYLEYYRLFSHAETIRRLYIGCP